MLGRLHNLVISRYPKLFWRWRHIIQPHWADTYASNAAILHPHRRLLSDAVKAFEPKSIFEFGCASGSNLLWFSVDCPDASIYGWDISKKAREKAKETYKDYKNVAIYDSEDEWGGRTYDCIVTDATLIYFKSNEAYDLLQRFKKLVNKGIVVCEWDKSGDSELYAAHWLHDYAMMIGPERITKTSLAEVWPSGGWQKFGHVVTWAKNG